MSTLWFTVYGIPAPQGSKTPWGSEANPNTRPWRASVAATAAEAMHGTALITGPVSVTALFRFPRPKAHFRTGKRLGELRDDAPTWHARTPDADKLQRAIGDALTGIVLRDDAQISRWVIEKVYGEPACVALSIGELAVRTTPVLPGLDADSEDVSTSSFVPGRHGA